MHLKPLAAAAMLAVGALASPVSPAVAEETDCVTDAVRDCNKEFPPSDYYNIAIRGWCYMIHIAICKAL
jgi:hypothetical protein